MIAADRAAQRPPDARLLVLDECGRIHHAPRPRLADFLHRGDLLVANDAATLPASLHGIHLRSGAPIELRLAGGGTLATQQVQRFVAIVFGAGDWRTTTEQRALPPVLRSGDRFALGPLTAQIEALLDHPRLIALRFEQDAATIWAGLARHGRPIQYAHLSEPLALWDVWTPVAGPPVAFEPPSAGFALDWQALATLRARGIGYATLTHAAGISSTGDPGLDRRLPFDEPYRIPARTADAIRQTRGSGGRIIAVGTTVVRALEHAARRSGRVAAGDGIANQRLGVGSRLRIADAILSGTHESGTSHYELLRAFANAETLGAADAELHAGGYRTHEFGDSVLVFKPAAATQCALRRAA